MGCNWNNDDSFSRMSCLIRASERLTAGILKSVTTQACRRLPRLAHTRQAENFGKLAEIGASIDSVLTLLALEAPQWRLRRLAYDEGEWHCSLSRQPELPFELDDTLDACHPDPALSILSALLEVLRRGEPQLNEKQTPVPTVSFFCEANMRCENFG